MNQVIHNYQELAMWFGLPEDADEEAVDHAIYDQTVCGASLKYTDFDEDNFQLVYQKWAVMLDPYNHPGKLSVESALLYHKKSEIKNSRDNWIKPDQLPEKVKLFLGMQENNLVDIPSLDYLKKNVDSPELKEFNCKLENTILYFQIPTKRYISRDGISIGSIVEGTDAEVAPIKLFFPFTTNDLQGVIRTVEDKAKEIWQEMWADKMRGLLS